MRMQHAINWSVRVRIFEFVVNQCNLERPGLSVGLRQVQVNPRWDVNLVGDKGEVCSLHCYWIGLITKPRKSPGRCVFGAGRCVRASFWEQPSTSSK